MRDLPRRRVGARARMRLAPVVACGCSILAGAIIGCVSDETSPGASLDGGGANDGGTGTDAAGDVGGSDVVGADGADAAACDPTKPFGGASSVLGFSSTTADGGPAETTFGSLSADALQIIVASDRKSGTANWDLFLAKRDDPSQGFGAATELTALNAVGNGTGDERGAAFSGSGLAVFFYSNVSGSYDLYTSTRASTSATDFAAPNPVPNVNTPDTEFDPHPSTDGSVLYFARQPAAGKLRIYRALAASNYASPSVIPELDSTNGSQAPVPTADDLGLYFTKRDSAGGDTIWFATRATNNGSYTNIQAVSELGSGVRPVSVTPDGCTLYFWASGSQTYTFEQLYAAKRKP